MIWSQEQGEIKSIVKVGIKGLGVSKKTPVNPRLHVFLSGGDVVAPGERVVPADM
jgi:hypothetical protein